DWLNIVKTGACQSCHALGTKGMRTIPKELGAFPNSVEAWRRRLQSGGARALMTRDITRLDTEIALKYFADWTDRIARGELPFAKPERPQGMERNFVVTLWDWSRPTAYLHDEVSTDRRNPSVNANGKIYASTEDSTDLIPVLDPKTHTAAEVLHPVRDPNTPSSKNNPYAASAYWGPEPIWDSKTLDHNPMMDEKGRIWFTSRDRPGKNPDVCKQGSDHPSAKVVAIEVADRHLSMYDPATGKCTLISTCFQTHHLNFGNDANQTLWTSTGIGGPGVLGWLNRKMFEETGDEMKSQGWTPFVIDTNGNGKRDAFVGPDQPVDPTKDKRVLVNIYAVGVSPSDGAVWGTVVGDPGSGEASYYTWLDRFDTFGLGRNVPIAMGNLSDSIYALVDGKFITFRIPYPSGFFPKNVDGRIDDPNAGWKGKSLWSTSGTRTMFHLEGGKTNR